MNPISAGAAAPDFQAPDNKEQNISLSAYRGRKMLLSWHPLAWTSVCTDQMRALETHWDNFTQLNTIPFGISVDPQPSKAVWAMALQIFNVPLLSDFWPHGGIAKAYGIFDETEGISVRANIIIDEAGMIKWVKVYPWEQLPDINEVLNMLSQ